MILMGIDPGTFNSAFVLSHDYKPFSCDKIANTTMREKIIEIMAAWDRAKLLIERPVCHKHSGAEVSDTAIWAGVFIGTWGLHSTIQYNRQKVRMHCFGKTASDSKIRRALIKRFDPDAYTETRSGVLKEKPEGSDWFRGFTADIWQAYALIVTHLDTVRGKTWQQMMEK